MGKMRILQTFLFIFILAHGFHAQTRVKSDLVDADMMNLIRKEKFDLVLPQIMRDNKIDMWIHVLRAGDPDSLADTAGDTLEILIHKLEEAGYVYIDRDRYDRNADPKKTQVHIDFHALGKEVLQTEAPRISPLGPDWIRDLKIPLFHTFTFEYMVHMPVPKWGKGKHLYALMHDGVMVTERGIEFPYPPVERIRIIR